MQKQTILQKGGPDLFVFCHPEPGMTAARARQVTSGAVVLERWGEGTRSYRPLVESYGGYEAWIAGIAAACEVPRFEHVTLITWSAGSQVAKDVCRGEAWPEAIVMLDGLYGDKPKGARLGDGKVILDEGLEAIASYGAAAARGERVMVITCSRIPTPYASSLECSRAVEQRVADEVGAPLADDGTADPKKLGAYARAVSAGDLHMVEFRGANGAEHFRQGQLHAAVWRLWLPWLSA